MARTARRVYPGLPHLILQEGDPALPVFRVEDDRADGVAALREAAGAGGVQVHAYAVFGSTMLALVTPQTAQDLSRFVQRVDRRCAAAIHRRHGSRGMLWNGRFRSAAIEPERYLLEAMCWIEQAPVRAGVVASASDGHGSSAGQHLGRETGRWVVDHPLWWSLGNTPFEREMAYRNRLDTPLSPRICEDLATAVRRGWPLGSRDFVERLATDGRPAAPRRRGRPTCP